MYFQSKTACYTENGDRRECPSFENFYALQTAFYCHNGNLSISKNIIHVC
jgi:hypothetical protein